MSTTTTSTPLPYTRESRALLPDALRLGPVRLAVTDLDRAVDFYRRVVGLTVASRGREGAQEVAHLSAGGEDVVVLQEEPGARPAGKHARHAGLYHVALNYPTRLELARTLRRIVETGVRIGAADHATHEAIYLADPDGNGLELAWDAPRERWPTTLEEYMRVGREPLDFHGLLALTAHEPLAPSAAPGLRVGHLHLHVGDVQVQVAGEGVPPAPPDVVGLREWRIYLPTVADVDAARARLVAGRAPVAAAGPDAFTTADPWGIPLRVGVDPAR
jgi:catechol 2,3-dioxygenase